MSRFTISVYQRKLHGQLEWRTLGLGPLDVMKTGRSATKLQRSIADELRQSIRAATPAGVARLELVRGRRLRRVHLELGVQTPNKRVKLSGLFPIVIEPRRRTPTESVKIAYHPLMQAHWMLVDDELPLADQLRRFLGKAWAGTHESVLEGLATDGKDVLRAFSFSETGPQLIDELPEQGDDVFADLEPDPHRAGKKRRRRHKRKYGRKHLRSVGENVTARVADEQVPLGRPREPWRAQLAHLLNGPRKTPVVLIGPSGVGKSTLIHRWVADLLEADDYVAHRNLDTVQEVWRIGARRILAGMSHHGEWEKRVVGLAAEAADPRVVLFADDLHTFGRAGRSRDSDRTLADVLRSPLARGELTIVGEATEAQWHRLREDAAAFADLFTVLRVTPTDRRETVQLVLHEARQLEPRYRVRFSADAYRSVISLGDVLQPGSAQPGVAIDLARKIARDAAFDRKEESGGVWPLIDADAALSFLARRTGLPEALLRPDAQLAVDELSAGFASHVLGQADAVRAAVDLVTRIRAGLTDADRPFATYLFTGPTGTGKTQMAKTIAGFLYGDTTSRLVRVDMGEMSGPDAVARLIGDRWDPRGLLTDAVREQPFCVVLLDEIEKAHPTVLQLLLQLLDEGRLTDAAGDTANFSKCVIVMTSNLGAKSRAALGFGDRAEGVLRDVDRAVREFFPPELFNRIDRVVRFRPLSPEVAELVTEKELAELLARRGLTDRKVFVFAHPEAVKRMAAEAFDDRGGARSVKRFLDTHVGSLLANELARASRAQMRVIRVYGGGPDGYRLHVSELTEAEPSDAGFRLEGVVDAPTSELRERLPKLLSRVRKIERSPEVDRVRESRTRLMRNLGDADAASRSALYHLDRFLEELELTRERLETHSRGLRDVDRGQARAPRASPERRTWTKPTARVLRRGAAASHETLTRRVLLATLGEVALLEGALPRLHEPSEHRVVVEMLRVGRGRRAPSFVPDAPGFLEWLAKIYTALRGELMSVAARTEHGVLHEGELAEMMALRPTMLVFELEGVAVRSLLRGEEGCHVWSSLLSGSEIVRVRLVEAPSARAHLEAHRDAMLRFERALDGAGVATPPDDPEGLTPAVRSVRFDPPLRPGETSVLEVEDFVTGQVIEERARSLDTALASLVWLNASRLSSDGAHS